MHQLYTCYWNVYWECEEDDGQGAQNYLVLAPAIKEKPMYLAEDLDKNIGHRWITGSGSPVRTSTL